MPGLTGVPSGIPRCEAGLRVLRRNHVSLALKVITGYEDSTLLPGQGGLFRPEENMTRGLAVKTLVQAFGIPLGTDSASHFSDVPPGSPYAVFIETAYMHGLASGYKDGTFRPEQSITRGALVKMAVQSAGWELAKPEKPTFTDVDSGSPLYPYVEAAAAHAIL